MENNLSVDLGVDGIVHYLDLTMIVLPIALACVAVIVLTLDVIMSRAKIRPNRPNKP
jgi:accessory gene regulator protein AgrB